MHLDGNQMIYEDYSCMLPYHGHLLLTFCKPRTIKSKRRSLSRSLLRTVTDYSRASEAKVETPEGVSVITFPARGHNPLIEWEYPEFQSLCPVSEREDPGGQVRKGLSHELEKQEKLAGIYHRRDSGSFI